MMGMFITRQKKSLPRTVQHENGFYLKRTLMLIYYLISLFKDRGYMWTDINSLHLLLATIQYSYMRMWMWLVKTIICIPLIYISSLN